MKKILALLIMVLTILVIMSGCNPTKNSTQNNNNGENDQKDDVNEDVEVKNEGKEAPNLVLFDLDGNEVSLASFKGQKVYIKYWASWCSICTAGLSDINDLSETDDFVVLTIVTPDYRGEQSADDFTKWFKSLDYKNIIVLLDQDGEYRKDFGVIGVPTSIFIGSDGIITSLAPGHKSNEDIIEVIEGIY